MDTLERFNAYTMVRDDPQRLGLSHTSRTA